MIAGWTVCVKHAARSSSPPRTRNGASSPDHSRGLSRSAFCNLIIKATLKSEGLEVYCNVLTRVESSSSSHGSSYEPTIVVGTHSINKEQKLELLFAGYVLGKIQGQVPEHGKVI
jgi:hypothetical protein